MSRTEFTTDPSHVYMARGWARYLNELSVTVGDDHLIENARKFGASGGVVLHRDACDFTSDRVVLVSRARTMVVSLFPGLGWVVVSNV
jgi:hypothetical protein